MIDGLLEEVKNEQDTLLAKDAARSEVHRRLQTHAPKRRASRVSLWLAAAAILCAVGIATWTMLPRAPLTYAIESDELHSNDGFVSAKERARISFSDGSRIDLGALSTARIVDVTDHGAGLALSHGRLHAEIHHERDTNWRVFAGPYSVLVTGTKFDVVWSDTQAELNVSVSEGSVRVTGSCMPDALSLAQGERVTLRCDRVATAVPANQPVAPTSTNVVATTPAYPLPVRVNEHGSDMVATPAPSNAVASANQEFSERIARAEQAATSGNVADARVLLFYVHEHAGASPDGALAAFLLGRLAFDAQSDFAEAARWFAEYENASPNGVLIREAMGRHLEALVRLHRNEDAAAMGVRYLARFPDGPHAALARQQQP